MSLKSSVVDLLKSKKDEEVAAVGAKYDALVTAVEALPDDQPGDVSELQKQLDAEKSKSSELQTQVDAAKAEIEKDHTDLAAEQGKEAALQKKLDAIKAALEA